MCSSDLTIGHPGHFRIAFSLASDADFDTNILFDNIQHGVDVDPATNIFSKTIKLPNIQCTDCTLQLIQVMTDRSPPTNYYSCADIQLTFDGNPPPVMGDTTPPADISGLSIVPGDTVAALSWANPPSDFFQVLILQDTQTIAANPMVGTGYIVSDVIGTSTVIYKGNAQSYLAQGLMNNSSTYYFKVFAYDSSLNYATAGVEMNAMLPPAPANSPPAVTMIAEQSQTVTTTVMENAGEVIVQVNVNDPNPSDTHSYNWSATDSRLVDIDLVADNIFTFNPSGLVAGTYSLKVTVSDTGSPVLDGQASMDITVVAAPASTNNNSSSDGGGSISGFGLLFCLIFGLRRRWVRRIR